jgi:hypothetical protein
MKGEREANEIPQKFPKLDNNYFIISFLRTLVVIEVSVILTMRIMDLIRIGDNLNVNPMFL